MSDIFLSYASRDRQTAKALAAALEQHGWTVWWDRRIPTGKDYGGVIEAQLAAARCVIVLWTSNSVASEWVKTEAADAKDRHLLVPVFIEQVKLPLEFRRIQAADLTDWKGETTHAGFSTLVGDLTGILGAPPARPEGRTPLPPPPPVEAPLPAWLEKAGADAQEEEEEEDGGLQKAPTVAPTVIEPADERPKGVWPRYRLHILAGAAAAAVGLTAIIIAFTSSRGPSVANANNADNRNVAASNSPGPPTPRPGSSNQTPPANGGRNPPANIVLNLDRSKRLGLLLRQLNSPDEKERLRTTGALKTEYHSDPQAVEQALALLDESKIDELSPQGLINVLFFLNNTTDDAWTAESAQKAESALGNIAKKPLGPQASEALGKFKDRTAALKRAKAQP